MLLLIPLVVVVVALAAAVVATRSCESANSPLPRIDEHGYRVGTARC